MAGRPDNAWTWDLYIFGVAPGLLREILFFVYFVVHPLNPNINQQDPASLIGDDQVCLLTGLTSGYYSEERRVQNVCNALRNICRMPR